MKPILVLHKIQSAALWKVLIREWRASRQYFPSKPVSEANPTAKIWSGCTPRTTERSWPSSISVECWASTAAPPESTLNLGWNFGAGWSVVSDLDPGTYPVGSRVCQSSAVGGMICPSWTTERLRPVDIPVQWVGTSPPQVALCLGGHTVARQIHCDLSPNSGFWLVLKRGTNVSKLCI